MRKKQMDLVKRIEFQRRVVQANPNDLVEETNLESLVAELRDTFYVIENPVYKYSPSRAVLKLVS